MKGVNDLMINLTMLEVVKELNPLLNSLKWLVYAVVLFGFINCIIIIITFILFGPKGY